MGWQILTDLSLTISRSVQWSAFLGGILRNQLQLLADCFVFDDGLGHELLCNWIQLNLGPFCRAAEAMCEASLWVRMPGGLFLPGTLPGTRWYNLAHCPFGATSLLAANHQVPHSWEHPEAWTPPDTPPNKIVSFAITNSVEDKYRKLLGEKTQCLLQNWTHKAALEKSNQCFDEIFVRRSYCRTEPHIILTSLCYATYIICILKLFLMRIWIMVTSMKQFSYVWDSKRWFYLSKF